MEQHPPDVELDRFERKQASALSAIPPIEHTIRDGTLHVTRRFRGLTLDQAMGYLESLGGTRTGDTEIEGDGWQAILRTDEVAVGPSYRLTEVIVSWIGDPAIVESLVLHFRLKAFRAPG